MSIPLEIKCDFNETFEPLPHFWEHTVGSDHALMALRADYQKHLTRAHRELGCRYVRFHGLLSDDMGTLTCQNEKLIDSFFNADQIFDFLLSIGMRPFVELSFMPQALASGDDTVFHYKGNITPPKKMTDWAALIERLARHWCERYGADEVRKWFFEVWNEPNLEAFWTGGQKKYFEFYEATAEVLKKVDSQLKVGGPATAKNEWISEFKKFAEKEKVPLDFISTHIYPTDAFGKPDDDTESQLAASHEGVLREKALEAKAQSGKLPLYYTEWCTSSNPFDELHDQAYAAAYALKAVLQNRGLVEAYSYWTFSDIFEENYFSSKPFHGGFGLMNIHGIPKPVYRAFQLLHQVGSEVREINLHHPTLNAWLFKKGETDLQIILSNGALPRHKIKSQKVLLDLKNYGAIASVKLQRIDETHANATTAWKKMGSPQYLKPNEVAELEAASMLKDEQIEFVGRDQASKVEIELKPQSVVVIFIQAQKKLVGHDD